MNKDSQRSSFVDGLLLAVFFLSSFAIVNKAAEPPTSYILYLVLAVLFAISMFWFIKIRYGDK